VQGLAIGPIVRVLGERGTLLLGLPAAPSALQSSASAPTGLLFWSAFRDVAVGISGAALQSLMTRLVAPITRPVAGRDSSVESVSQLVGPFLFTLDVFIFHRRARTAASARRAVLACRRW